MRILAATLPVSDPDALTRWYADTLEITELPVSFVRGEGEPHHFALHVADLDAWRARLRMPLLRDEAGDNEFDFSDWGCARALYFADPAGNIVELIARPQPHPELTLAEVGLPVEDVGAAVEALERELGIPHYDGDRETFSAVGADDGLLIVVSVGRGWFPPGVPAGRAPLAVEIASGRAQSLDVPGSGHVVASI